ncbi:MAG: immunoglobulin domain-containing protein, partial [Opitutaceae bacterium]|nr:immunoglobulin domain-containing protein [Opitutaceae bacterium]
MNSSLAASLALLLALAPGLRAADAPPPPPVDPARAILTLAGTGVSGATNGPGATATFHLPFFLAVAPDGHVFVSDLLNNAIRRITPAGEVSTHTGFFPAGGSEDGPLATAKFKAPSGLALDRAGNLYVADRVSHAIRRISANGQVTTIAGLAGTPGSADGPREEARFNFPNGLAVDASGNIFVADTGNSTIRRIDINGFVTTLAGSPGVEAAVNGPGGVARFSIPFGLALDTSGNLFVADTGNDLIRRITPAGVVSTVAGNQSHPPFADGTGDAARFDNPRGICVDAAGNLFVTDFGNAALRRITPAGVVTTIAGAPRVRGSADGRGDQVRFDGPMGIAVDAAGNLYVCDAHNHKIRRSVFAPSFQSQPQGLQLTAGTAAVLTANVASDVPATFQWRKNGLAVPGATTATLSFASVQGADAGVYTLVATNPAGSVTSQPANLVVAVPAPVITAQPASQ